MKLPWSKRGLINPSVPRFPAQPISWIDVARICRRICLLRECGQTDEAELVRRGALADALAAISLDEHSEGSIEQRLEATFAAEAERVANAAVLAELLTPLIGKQLQRRDEFASPSSQPAAIVESVPPLKNIAPLPASLHTAPPRADAADIAHFIDEMLAQERPAPGGANVRRAS